MKHTLIYVLYSRAPEPSCYTILGCSNVGLQLSIGGKTITCPRQGGEVSVPGFFGTVQCPMSNKICQILQEKCNGSGVLMADGSCTCNPGYSGEDCSEIDCPQNRFTGALCNGPTHGTCDKATGQCQVRRRAPAS